MALICDPDYLAHTLRLNYLRYVDDPYAARLITFDPRYQTNAHVVQSGLADVDRWPELLLPQSPQVSDDEDSSKKNRSGFPGTRLKHSQTILGPTRVGALGLRVTGRRSVTNNTPSGRSFPVAGTTPRRTRADSEPTPAATRTPSPANAKDTPGSPDTYDEALSQMNTKRRSVGGSPLSELVPTEEDELEAHADGHVALQNMSMSHIVVVQARRRRRRAHFSSVGNNKARPVIVSETTVSPEVSPEEEGQTLSASLPDDDFVAEGDSILDVENDDFDPDFAPPQIRVASDSSGALNSMPNSILSASMSSAYNSSLQIVSQSKGRNKLSPVNEMKPSEYPRSRMQQKAVDGDGEQSGTVPQNERNAASDSLSEIIQPAPTSHAARRVTSREAVLSKKPQPNGRAGKALALVEEPVFTRRKVPPRRPATSTLTAKLASSNTSSNPFTELYALISGRAEVASMDVVIYFPHAQKPANRPLTLTVRKDATVEEVIGFSLWSYWEEGWLPKLDEGVTDEQETLSAVGWILRIAEEDGEVDEDFPAPDRMGKISKFSFDAYAIIEATPAQVAQNQVLEAKILRRPSRIIVSKKKQEPTGLAPSASAPAGPGVSALPYSALGASAGLLSTSLNISSSHGTQLLLRIRVANVEDTAVHYMTTISVNSKMYMQEVLDHACRKRKLEDPKDWALLSDDFKILVPSDRTVASLEGNSQLVLVQRSSLPLYGFAIDGDRRTGKSIDPNASIFRRTSEIQPLVKNGDLDFNVYKRYTVYRKLPMLVGRLERTLAIDGDYIHIMPSQNKARGVFDSGKTVSFHIKSLVSCSQSTKAPTSFKITFRRDGGDKRYDFEAESARVAAEIVTTVRGMRRGGLERGGTVNKSQRRSRQST